MSQRFSFERSHSKRTYKFQCKPCNESYYHGKWAKHLDVTIGKHIAIWPLPKKKVKLKGSAVKDHLLLFNNSLFSESVSLLTKENRKFLLELKESPHSNEHYICTILPIWQSISMFLRQIQYNHKFA